MTSLAHQLAEFSFNLRFEDIPSDVADVSINSVIDTVGVSVFGSGLPWSRMLIEYAQLYGSGGTSTILGTRDRVSAPIAALVNGALAHAFEMDNLRQPSAGVHPGSTLVPTMLAIGEEVGASGDHLLVSFVAGCEIMSRIGVAAGNSAEKLGFHSPGLTGTFGSAIVASKLLGLSAEQTANALGIAGSLCSGLLAFSKAGTGGMVKRLHTGRASEGGVLAARLASFGFSGPDVVFEGKFGFFDAFTRNPSMEKVLLGLGCEWETTRICFKSYPCHVTAHTPVYALQELREGNSFAAGDIVRIDVATSDKVLSHHSNYHPKDIAGVQYSLPFCLAVAMLRDPKDPRSFLNDPHQDQEIQELAQKVCLSMNDKATAPDSAWTTNLSVTLRSGQVLTIERSDFRGTPTNPMSSGEIDRKFLSLAEGVLPEPIITLDRLRSFQSIENINSLFT